MTKLIIYLKKNNKNINFRIKLKSPYKNSLFSIILKFDKKKYMLGHNRKVHASACE